nr:hypothetical protein [Maliibacterium massiliense]
MWSRRSFLLSTRIRLKGVRPRIRLRLPCALYVLYQLLLGVDPLLCLLAGSSGRRTRAAVDSVQAMMLGLMHEAPQQLVHVDVEEQGREIQVDIKTVGI